MTSSKFHACFFMNSSLLGEKIESYLLCLPNFFPLCFSTAPSFLYFFWRRKEASASIHQKVFMAWRRLLSQVAAVVPLPTCLSLYFFFFIFWWSRWSAGFCADLNTWAALFFWGNFVALSDGQWVLAVKIVPLTDLWLVMELVSLYVSFG